MKIKVKKLCFAYSSGHNILYSNFFLFQLIMQKLNTLKMVKIFNSTNKSLFKYYYVYLTYMHLLLNDNLKIHIKVHIRIFLLYHM